MLGEASKLNRPRGLMDLGCRAFGNFVYIYLQTRSDRNPHEEADNHE